MKKLYSFLATTTMVVGMFAQTVLTEWNFDGSNLTPAIGTGTITLVGGVTPNNQTGTNACNCPFVGGNPNTGKAYTTTTYPAQGTSSGTAGIMFNVDTTNYSGISITVDAYGSNTASKYIQLQYTTDGTSWTNSGNPVALAPSAWSTLSATLSSPADNNSAFAFRIVSVFDPNDPANKYAAIGASSNYATTGALRFDNVKISYAAMLAVSDLNITKVKFIKNTLVDSIVEFTAKTNVKIYNVSGQLVKSAAVNEGTSLDVSALAKGVYVVAGEVDGQSVSQKIIKK